MRAESHRLATEILQRVVAQRPCRLCNGKGSIAACPKCHGRGQILGYTPWGTPGGASCSDCKGTGQYEGAKCPDCMGQGYDR